MVGAEFPFGVIVRIMVKVLFGIVGSVITIFVFEHVRGFNGVDWGTHAGNRGVGELFLKFFLLVS